MKNTNDSPRAIYEVYRYSDPYLGYGKGETIGFVVAENSRDARLNYCGHKEIGCGFERLTSDDVIATIEKFNNLATRFKDLAEMLKTLKTTTDSEA